MVRLITGLFYLLLAGVLLQTCRTPEQVVQAPQQHQPEAEEFLEPVRLDAWEEEFRQQRYIADILYDALKAIDADRLLTPADNNAFSRFRQVLEIQPGNKVALQGIQDIVRRYIELAAEASRQGQFSQAQIMLVRARIVDPDNPAIAGAQAALAAEINSDDLFFELDASAVARKSDAIKAKLADIAAQAKRHDALFLITSPNDEHARWIFSVMREAVPGYRLRGNIELAGRTLIRLRISDALK